MEQPERDAHAYIDGLTGHETIHPQVQVLWFTCDEEIADLITLMNYCGIRTINSCQDNNRPNRGIVRRAWVEILGQNLLSFLAMLNRPGEVSDLESLSHRTASEKDPDDWKAFREDRSWHYEASVGRKDGELLPLTISIRFPYTDLPEVVARLRSAAREIDGAPVTQAADDSASPESSSPGDGDKA